MAYYPPPKSRKTPPHWVNGSSHHSSYPEHPDCSFCQIASPQSPPNMFDSKCTQNQICHRSQQQNQSGGYDRHRFVGYGGGHGRGRGRGGRGRCRRGRGYGRNRGYRRGRGGGRGKSANPRNSRGRPGYRSLLRQFRLREYIQVFEEYGYEDPRDWSSLTPQKLKEMGFKDGHIHKFKRNYVNWMNQQKVKQFPNGHCGSNDEGNMDEMNTNQLQEVIKRRNEMEAKQMKELQNEIANVMLNNNNNNDSSEFSNFVKEELKCNAWENSKRVIKDKSNFVAVGSEDLILAQYDTFVTKNIFGKNDEHYFMPNGVYNYFVDWIMERLRSPLNQINPPIITSLSNSFERVVECLDIDGEKQWLLILCVNYDIKRISNTYIYNTCMNTAIYCRADTRNDEMVQQLLSEQQNNDGDNDDDDTDDDQEGTIMTRRIDELSEEEDDDDDDDDGNNDNDNDNDNDKQKSAVSNYRAFSRLVHEQRFHDDKEENHLISTKISKSDDNGHHSNYGVNDDDESEENMDNDYALDDGLNIDEILNDINNDTW